jgi:hypothetical protein
MQGNELLWNSGIYEKLGGFRGMREESRTIVAATLAQYPWEVARMMIRNVLAALVTREPGAELRPEIQTPSMIPLFAHKFGNHAVTAYRSSMEMQGRIPHALLGRIDAVVFPAALVALALLSGFYARRNDRDAIHMAIFMGCGVFCDIVMCACLSGVFDRYQARVTWLIVFAAIALALRFFDPTEKDTI